ncbi:MAG: hypothetical protein K2X03_11950 [Bryobacteraceae bacterium]|nr:hypothetical protein [Bryobacteraceae bacterium]
MKIAILALLFDLCALAQGPGANAALRYWSAFGQMQDAAWTTAQTQNLNRVLDGTAPYNEAAYQEVLDKNRAALDTLARGTALPVCDWGLEYELGPDAPVEYARKGLALGRLNALQALRLAGQGNRANREGAVRALAAGLRFSRGLAEGGTLFSTVIAQTLLMAHLRAVETLHRAGPLTANQQASLRAALEPLGSDGLDWAGAMKRELRLLDRVDAAAVARLAPLYLAALEDPSRLPNLQTALASASPAVANAVPRLSRVLDRKRELAERVRAVRSLVP